MEYLVVAVSKMNKIKKLSPDTVLSVFHGTEIDDAYDMVIHGIDGRKRVGRSYPHFVNIDDEKPVMVNRGLFISPFLEGAIRFGRAVIKFKTEARDLYNIFPSLKNIRDDKKLWKDKFPKSYDPGLSAFLSGRAWKSEPQALYRGRTSPRAIERVYIRDASTDKEWAKKEIMRQYFDPEKYESVKVGKIKGTESYISIAPDEFIEWYQAKEEGAGNKVSKNIESVIYEPQEKIKSVDEFAERVAGGKGVTKENVKKYLEKSLKRAETFEEQIQKLQVSSPQSNKSSAVPYSVAKKGIMKILKELGIEKAPTQDKEPERYHGF